ncbi:Uncharacterised protein [uncultured archaeon]|nr:Uncharacterised protein [uncultured archaeon]
MNSIKIPSLGECEALLLEHNVPENVLAHSEAVRKVADFLARHMKGNGVNVDLDLVDAAARVHDLMKIECLGQDHMHGIEAKRVLAEKGYPEFGEILKQHGLDEVLKFGKGTPFEAKILWYADKRVNHDKIVSLNERFAYLKERYGSKSEAKLKEILSTEKPAFALEKELLKMAKVNEDLKGL